MRRRSSAWPRRWCFRMTSELTGRAGEYLEKALAARSEVEQGAVLRRGSGLAPGRSAARATSASRTCSRSIRRRTCGRFSSSRSRPSTSIWAAASRRQPPAGRPVRAAELPQRRPPRAPPRPPVRVKVTLSAKLTASVPSSAPLFVLVRDPRQAGPPLAVKRLSEPVSADCGAHHVRFHAAEPHFRGRAARGGGGACLAFGQSHRCGGRSVRPRGASGGRGRRGRHRHRSRDTLSAVALTAVPLNCMDSPFSLTFRSTPSIVPSYARIVFVRKAAVVPDGVQLPRLEAVLTQLQARTASAWRRIAPCAAVARRRMSCPWPIPHVLATPVHLALLSSSAFPVRMMGLVHLRNHIEQVPPAAHR